jgi:hypothetical protein
MREEVTGVGDYVTRSFMICAECQIVLEGANLGE